jgi:hypothetical protein
LDQHYCRFCLLLFCCKFGVDSLVRDPNDVEEVVMKRK